MTDQDAYRRYSAKAEECLNIPSRSATIAAYGNAWATLALAAAQERVQPANRPTDEGLIKVIGQVRDGDGDLWTIAKDGRYRIGDVIEQTGERTLPEIAALFGGYTEVT